MMNKTALTNPVVVNGVNHALETHRPYLNLCPRTEATIHHPD
ncbi:MAG: hypothetical protein QM498_01515 [Desulfobacterium sp.]